MGRLSAQWVIDRALCVFRCLELAHVPRADRARALALKLPSLSPFRQPGHYVVWKGARAQVWSWDDSLRQKAASALVDLPDSFRCIPESLLQPLPSKGIDIDDVRLIKGRSGFDLQVWRAGALILSRYFPSLPDYCACQTVLRGVVVPEVQPHLSVREWPLLERPWARNSCDTIDVNWERGLSWVLACSLFTGGGFQLGEGISWWWAERELRQRFERLDVQAEPVFQARVRALGAAREAKRLLGEFRGTRQFELIEQVIAVLPKGAQLLSWRYRSDRVEVRVATRELDPRHYVGRLQESGLFGEVGVDTLPSGDGVVLQLDLRQREGGA
ncbi:hypothetical protein LMK08_19310 [Metapseudomonas furukawaii]|uniref:hypothetical protein n=1 Tax=Metapseudomonas furukawaii TaxID=1149133 RepID=UPI00227CB456|nr:hypothetical protein [Pseudomonas furukawaii]WAG77493.1 hypothetical protein LMK08_19310 [Pseudomonas furukawaii]